MTTTFSERLRRALRDDLRNPPYRLVRSERGLGPVVERDGIEMAVTVQGRSCPRSSATSPGRTPSRGPCGRASRGRRCTTGGCTPAPVLAPG